MRALRCIVLCITLILMINLQPAAAANERCRGLAKDAKQRIAGQLDEAELALELGDLELASERVAYAARPSAVADVSLDKECMGPELRPRYYQVKKKITSALGRQAQNSGQKRAWQSAMGHYVDGDNRKDVTRLLEGRIGDANDASTAGNRLRWKLDTLQRTIDNGHELLGEEKTAPDYYQSSLKKLIKRSQSKADSLLSQEDDVINRPVTAQENQLASVQENMQGLQGSLLDESMEVDTEMLIASFRAGESMTILKDAQDWLDWIESGASDRVNARAVMRGNALLKRADDSGNPLESRDVYYEDAAEYYQIAGADQKLAAAEKARAAIQPALLAERQSQEQRMETKLEQMKKDADDFKKSTQMSAEEKQEFESEADALEAELGF